MAGGKMVWRGVREWLLLLLMLLSLLLLWPVVWGFIVGQPTNPTPPTRPLVAGWPGFMDEETDGRTDDDTIFLFEPRSFDSTTTAWHRAHTTTLLLLPGSCLVFDILRGVLVWSGFGFGFGFGWWFGKGRACWVN